MTYINTDSQAVSALESQRLGEFLTEAEAEDYCSNIECGARLYESYVLDGKIYCKECYIEKLQEKYHFYYHAELLCEDCGNEIQDMEDDYFNIDNKMVCKQCFGNRLFNEHSIRDIN